MARPIALFARLCVTTALVATSATVLLQVTGTVPAAAADVAPTVTTQPVSHSYTSGQSLTFTAAASGTPSPTVQWQYSLDTGSTWTNLSGATSTTFTSGALNGLENNWELRAVFTNSVSSATSNAAVMTFTAAPVVTTQPLSQSYTSGQSLTFTAAASGTPSPTVQWQYSLNTGSTWTNLSGATSTTFTSGALNGLENNWELRAVFTNSVSSATSNPATMRFTAAPPPSHGYWLVGSDGGIFTFGQAQFQGSTGSLRLQRPVVGITPTPNKNGYWLVASDGGVFAFNAPFVQSIPGLGLHPAGSGLSNSLNEPIVGIVSSTSGQGYYMVASDGGVFAFNSTFAGSCPGIGGCSGAAVAVTPDASGNGYWLVTATGHVYAFGDAPYFGAPGPQSSSITSMVRTPDRGGYWVLDANGQVFPYGDAANLGGPIGSTGGFNPATAIFATPDGGGYWVASAYGSVFPYGDAPNDGSMTGTHLNGYIVAGTGF